jgi:hypothetical protein
MNLFAAQGKMLTVPPKVNLRQPNERRWGGGVTLLIFYLGELKAKGSEGRRR